MQGSRLDLEVKDMNIDPSSGQIRDLGNNWMGSYNKTDSGHNIRIQNNETEYGQNVQHPR